MMFFRTFQDPLVGVPFAKCYVPQDLPKKPSNPLGSRCTEESEELEGDLLVSSLTPKSLCEKPEEEGRTKEDTEEGTKQT